jgi:hypothetical protein
MSKIVLISCVSLKQDRPSPARELYVSPLFKKNLAYAESLNPDKIFILSAKYGLLEIDEKVAPYDLTLNTMKMAAVREWADSVLAQLRVKADLKEDQFIFLAGQRYRKYLIPFMGEYQIPMEGLGIGRQLSYLTKALRGS